ncbi:hypothetical protein Hsar01_01110 [Haloferula sargassicola]|uniref:PAS domain S-box protein n=2 Tax=Haloferula sargassicola TaxID=490096 RepID=A0ABP9UMH8_9BACT
MQNEELQRTYAELLDSRDRYAELYDFAPVGYLTVDGDGRIREANLTLATLLRTSRGALVGSRFTDYVARESQDAIHFHRQKLEGPGSHSTCEVMLRRGDGTSFPASLKSSHVSGGRYHCAVSDISQRRDAEEALRQREQLGRQILSSLQEGLVVFDANLRFRVWNPFIASLTGTPESEVLGRHPDEVFPWMRELKLVDTLEESLAGGHIRHRDVHQQHPEDGRDIWLSGRSAPLRDFHGRITGVVVSLQDITERRRIHEQLRQLNRTLESRVAEQTGEIRLLAEAIEHLGEGVLITTDHTSWRDSRIVFANPAMCSISGFPETEMIGKTPRIFDGPRTHSDSPENIEHHLERDRFYHTELVHYRQDGSAYPAELLITLIRSADGDRTHFVSIHRDLSERKADEEAKFSLGQIIEASLNEVFIFEIRTLRFVQVNHGGRKNLGYSLDELRTLTPLDLKPDLTRERFLSMIAPVVGGEKSQLLFESRHRRQDGSFYDVDVALQRCRFRGHDCCVAIVIDTTERRRLEQEVVRASEEERQRIAVDLHDDLGAVLTALKLRTEGLAEELAEPRLGREGKLGTIISMMGEAIGKIRQIAHGLRPVGQEPDDLVNSLEALCHRVHADSPLSCRLLIEGSVEIADSIVANHLYRIAQEALINALRHSGGSRIDIFLRQHADRLELEVADDGRGFDGLPDHHLGLQIMRYRAQAMNGTLSIDSAADKPTRITCQVPCKGNRPAPTGR